jgi:hypothetical protein
MVMQAATDLLAIAGANKAKLIIIAISDEVKRLEMIETIKKHFPTCACW